MFLKIVLRDFSVCVGAGGFSLSNQGSTRAKKQ
jgi:hypothetical protein